MKGSYRKQFWGMFSVVLCGLLVLGVCATVGFAEQMGLAPEGAATNDAPVLGTQDATHTIEVINNTPGHGTVATSVNGASANQAAADETVTVVATPTDSEHYTLDTLTVTKAGEPSTTVDVNYNNTFTMPDYGVTVTASFRERHVHDGIELEPWKGIEGQPLPRDCGWFYLTEDVMLTNTWDVPCGGDTIQTHLCLNGHSITLQQSDDNSKPVIRIAQGEQGAPSKLVLYDCGEGKGAITHAENKKGIGVLVESGGDLVMRGGSISGNTAGVDGRGVVVNGGTFTMAGGTIQNNGDGDVSYGGGVAVIGGTFTLTGGTIQNNGGDNVGYGGGVYVGENGTLALTGGTITNNTARVGGGVACIPRGQVSISGDPKVTGNKTENHHHDALGDNLCLIWPRIGSGPLVIIDNTLGEGAKIGISIIRDGSMPESPMGSFFYIDGTFTKGYVATQSTDPWQCFTSENPGRQVLWTPDGTEAQLAVARHITVDSSITGGTVTLSKDVAAEDETIDIQATPNEGWELVSVTAKDTSGKDVPVTDNKELVVPASDVVVSATFKEKPAPPTPPTPTTPSAPSTPSTPSAPSEPSTPSTPSDPSGPSTPSVPSGPSTPSAPTDIHVTYAAHVQGKGDLPAASDGEVVGTTGESRRLEAMSANVDAGGIEYRAHLQNKGWGGWVADGKRAGTTGESRRLEAIQMRLTGSSATDGHHVWYRVHSQTYGWLGWACDGEPAGTAGMSKRAEAYQVLVLRGDAKPADYDASIPAYRAQVAANAHLQKTGWTGNAGAGMIGTTGEARRMEAIRIHAPHPPFAGGITYQVHEQRNGWTAERSDGDMAGTEGEARRIEAVRVRLSGEQAKHLSVWYRVHSQTFGWLGWARDGADAGTTGLSKRAEAVEVQVLPQGQTPSDFDASQAACVSR